jgi:thiol-disulfide isomerase/thioredoxin
VLDRREFLTKGAAAGVGALAGGSLLNAAVASGATEKGFAIGEKALKISAHDQYEGKTTVSHLSGRWVLLDVCARWCPPCNAAADQYAALVAEANSHGIALSTVSALIEGEVEGEHIQEGIPSTRADAEFWAVRYGYERETVLHCGGSTEAPLYKLIGRVCGFNGFPPAYPCYLLIDPTGVVRYFQRGANTNEMKGALASLTGVPLPGFYPLGQATPRRRPNIQSVTFSFGVQGGGTVSETLAVGASSSACSWTLEEEDFTGEPAHSTARAFLFPAAGPVDLSVPISAVLHPERIRTYVEANEHPTSESFLPLVLYSGFPPEENFLGGGGRKQVLNLADGTGSGLSPVNPESFEVKQPNLGTTPATVIEVEVDFQLSPEPYGRTREILEVLVSAGVHKPAQKLLHNALKELSHHNLAAAATDLTEAAKILGYNNDVARHVSFLANT